MTLQTIVVPFVDPDGTGKFLALEVPPPVNADSFPKRLAYAADNALYISDDRPFRVCAVKIEGYGEPCIEDVTASAIRNLVYFLRNPPSPTLRLDAAFGHLPAWFQNHDPSLTDVEIFGGDDPDAEDCNPLAMEREHGTWGR
jgi:hypothetical protein